MSFNENYFFPRDFERDYPVAVKGKGSWIWDDKGKKYLDGCAGANVTGIGHGVKEIAEAMARQAGEIAYVPPLHFLNKPTLKLTEKLINLTPEGFARVMLLSGGSEAMENALKIVRQYQKWISAGARRKKQDKTAMRVASRWLLSSAS